MLTNFPLRRDFILLPLKRQRQLQLFALVVASYFDSAYFINKLWTNDILGTEDLEHFKTILLEVSQEVLNYLPRYLHFPLEELPPVNVDFILKVVIPAYRFAAVPLVRSLFLFRGTSIITLLIIDDLLKIQNILIIVPPLFSNR